MAKVLELDERRGAVEALTGLAGTAAALGRHESAARIMAATEAERAGSRKRSGPRPCEKEVLKRWRGQVRDALDPARPVRLWREGRGLSFEAVVAGRRKHVETGSAA
jgi:hypothetical protein